MTVADLGRLQLAADLTLDIDGIRATVTGTGDRVTVHTDSPAALLDAVTSAALPSGVASISGPRALGRAADGLGAAGLQVQVTGPGGTLLTLGRPTRSPVGYLLTGSSNVRIGALRAVLPLGAHRLRSGVHPWHLLVAGSAGAAGLITVLIRRRRLR